MEKQVTSNSASALPTKTEPACHTAVPRRLSGTTRKMEHSFGVEDGAYAIARVRVFARVRGIADLTD